MVKSSQKQSCDCMTKFLPPVNISAHFNKQGLKPCSNPSSRQNKVVIATEVICQILGNEVKLIYHKIGFEFDSFVCLGLEHL